MPATLNDNLLTQLYLGFERDYRQLVREGMTSDDIRNDLYHRLHNELHNPQSSLAQLDSPEKLKAIKVLETVFSSHSDEIFRSQAQLNIDLLSPPRAFQIIPQPNLYCDSDNPAFTWQFLNTMLAAEDDTQLKKGNTQAYLVLLMVCLIAVTATLVAFYYMLCEFVDSIERFVYNEGWFQAGLSLAATLGGAAAGVSFGFYLAAIPIILFAFALNLANPIGLAIAGIVCLGVIGAALTCGFANWIRPDDKKALDPKDSNRFALTESEALNLEKKGLDPTKVKCAIVALRKQIGDEEVPYLVHRLFSQRGRETQACLQKIRQLRRGELESGILDIGDLRFDLRVHLLVDNDDSEEELGIDADERLLANS